MCRLQRRFWNLPANYKSRLKHKQAVHRGWWNLHTPTHSHNTHDTHAQKPGVIRPTPNVMSSNYQQSRRYPSPPQPPHPLTHTNTHTQTASYPSIFVLRVWQGFIKDLDQTWTRPGQCVPPGPQMALWLALIGPRKIHWKFQNKSIFSFYLTHGLKLHCFYFEVALMTWEVQQQMHEIGSLLLGEFAPQKCPLMLKKKKKGRCWM